MLSRIMLVTLGVGVVVLTPPSAQLSAQSGSPASPPELFTFDPSHSEASFHVRHLGLSRVRGTFSQISGSLLLDDADVTRSSVTVVIGTASLFTANERRDDDLRQNFFETERFSEIVFQSTSIVRQGEGLELHGMLQIKDITRPVTIPVEFLGEVVNAQTGNRIVGFQGELRIDRRDWGVAREGHPAEIARTIGNEVVIDLQVEAVRQNFASVGFQGAERPSAGQLLLDALEAGGMSGAKARFEEIRGAPEESLNLAPREFGVLAMKLIQSDRAGEAAEVLALALELHPDAPALHDWMGLALARAGRKEEALVHYARVLAAAPRNTSAIEMTRWLEGRSDRASSP